MPNRRVDSPAIRIAILCCFALAIVPRSTVYEHAHAGETPGHVHAWDGARLDSVRELIDEARGGHDHAHTHPHDEHGDGHDHARDPDPAPRSAARRVAAHGPAYAATAGPGARHAHTQAPFQSVARQIAAALPFDRLHAAVVVPAVARPSARTCPALRARAPPLSAQA